MHSSRGGVWASSDVKASPQVRVSTVYIWKHNKRLSSAKYNYCQVCATKLINEERVYKVAAPAEVLNHTKMCLEHQYTTVAQLDDCWKLVILTLSLLDSDL